MSKKNTGLLRRLLHQRGQNEKSIKKTAKSPAGKNPFQQMADSSQKVQQLRKFQEMANRHSETDSEGSPPVVQRMLIKKNGEPYSKNFRYGRKTHYNKTGSYHYYEEVKEMLKSDTNHNMTIKEAYNSLLKGKKAKKQSDTSKMEDDYQEVTIGKKRKLTYTTKGNSAHSEIEETLERPSKRRKISNSSHLSYQKDYRNNAGVDQERRIVNMHYSYPPDFYKNSKKRSVPYAAAHRTPSFFDFRAGKNSGNDYKNVDETSESHNKRHSAFESKIRSKLKEREQNSMNIDDLSYKVETEHQDIQNVDDRTDQIYSNLNIPISKERLKKVVSNIHSIKPDISYISKDKRTLKDSSDNMIIEEEVGPDYEMDLHPKYLDEKDRTMEKYLRGQYYKAGEDEVLSSDGDNSEFEDEPPKLDKRKKKKRKATKEELAVINEKMAYHQKKGRLKQKGEEVLKRNQERQKKM